MRTIARDASESGNKDRVSRWLLNYQKPHVDVIAPAIHKRKSGRDSEVHVDNHEEKHLIGLKHLQMINEIDYVTSSDSDEESAELSHKEGSTTAVTPQFKEPSSRTSMIIYSPFSV